MENEEFEYETNRLLNPYYQTEDKDTVKIYNDDASSILKRMSNESVHCIITSPAYFGLRKYINEYGHSRENDELGYEKRLECFSSGTNNACNECHVCNLINVFKECKKVLRKDGNLFIIYKNPYYNTVKGNNSADGGGWKQIMEGYSEGDLLDITGSIKIGMRKIGYKVRNEITWYKPNNKPDSPINRDIKRTETILHFTQSKKYYFDIVATMLPKLDKNKKPMKNKNNIPILKRRDDVWNIPHKKDYDSEAIRKYKHNAVFPEALVNEILKGTYSPYCNDPLNKSGACKRCGTPYARIYEKNGEEKGENNGENPNKRNHSRPYNRDGMGGSTLDGTVGAYVTIGWEKQCKCKCTEVVPCIILDPFMGLGTTSVVGLRNRLRVWGIELYDRYIEEIQKPRIEQCINSNPLIQLFVNRNSSKNI